MSGMFPTTLKKIMAYGVGFGSARMLVGAISAVYMLNKGISIADLGYLKTYQFLLIFLLDIPLSYVADSYSRKFSVIMAGVLASLWLLCMALADNYWWFYVAETFNALSLVLFNGAFIAYLIDVKDKLETKIDTKLLLATFNKYEYLLMAPAGLIGAVFIQTDSVFIWYVSAAIIAFLVCAFVLLLPKDMKTASQHTEKKTPALLRIGKDIAVIYRHLKTNAFVVFVQMVVVAVYMQILLQMWQPVLLVLIENSDWAHQGYVYGVALSLIFLVQSVSGRFLQQASGKTLGMCLLLLAVLPVPLTYLPSLADNRLLLLGLSVLGLSVLFFFARLMTIFISSRFHDSLQGDNAKLRASFEACNSTVTKLVLMLVFPLAAVLLNSWGVLALMGLMSLLGLMLAVMNRVKSAQGG